MKNIERHTFFGPCHVKRGAFSRVTRMSTEWVSPSTRNDNTRTVYAMIRALLFSRREKLDGNPMSVKMKGVFSSYIQCQTHSGIRVGCWCQGEHTQRRNDDSFSKTNRLATATGRGAAWKRYVPSTGSTRFWDCRRWTWSRRWRNACCVFCPRIVYFSSCNSSAPVLEKDRPAANSTIERVLLRLRPVANGRRRGLIYTGKRRVYRKPRPYKAAIHPTAERTPRPNDNNVQYPLLRSRYWHRRCRAPPSTATAVVNTLPRLSSPRRHRRRRRRRGHHLSCRVRTRVYVPYTRAPANP